MPCQKSRDTSVLKYNIRFRTWNFKTGPINCTDWYDKSHKHYRCGGSQICNSKIQEISFFRNEEKPNVWLQNASNSAHVNTISKMQFNTILPVYWNSTHARHLLVRVVTVKTKMIHCMRLYRRTSHWNKGQFRMCGTSDYRNYRLSENVCYFLLGWVTIYKINFCKPWINFPKAWTFILSLYPKTAFLSLGKWIQKIK